MFTYYYRNFAVVYQMPKTKESTIDKNVTKAQHPLDKRWYTVCFGHQAGGHPRGRPLIQRQHIPAVDQVDAGTKGDHVGVTTP